MQQDADPVEGINLSPLALERHNTAVSEATMNAIEHGNHNQPDLPVEIRVVIRESRLSVAITDQGGDDMIPILETPDLDLKLAGLQSPRGWGLFLIENMVDELHQSSAGGQHTLELIIYLKGRIDADAAP
jgi:anti-sigma regulatory factor (Ser/Thr protein kinase)